MAVDQNVELDTEVYVAIVERFLIKEDTFTGFTSLAASVCNATKEDGGEEEDDGEAADCEGSLEGFIC